MVAVVIVVTALVIIKQASGIDRSQLGIHTVGRLRRRHVGSGRGSVRTRWSVVAIVIMIGLYPA